MSCRTTKRLGALPARTKDPSPFVRRNPASFSPFVLERGAWRGERGHVAVAGGQLFFEQVFHDAVAGVPRRARNGVDDFLDGMLLRRFLAGTRTYRTGPIGLRPMPHLFLHEPLPSRPRGRHAPAPCNPTIILQPAKPRPLAPATEAAGPPGRGPDRADAAGTVGPSAGQRGPRGEKPDGLTRQVPLSAPSRIHRRDAPSRGPSPSRRLPGRTGRLR